MQPRVFGVEELGHRAAGGDGRTSTETGHGEVENTLSDDGLGHGLSNWRFALTAEAVHQVDELEGGAGAGAPTDGGPLAGQHGAQDGASAAEVSNESGGRNEDVVEEDLVEVVPT